ncbi:MAG: hypothetical protein H6744_16070 [Deltaproteobacteria bacterium]|nr:hypothetical protein [Deltaproteobacteria bacterium]MCB9788199.1 hypothetical protein [Deltaproteobacteria bacterium]
MRRALAVSLLALAALVTGGAADDDYVRLVLDQPAPTPYSVVRYEVARRGRATMAVHRRQLPGYDEPLHGMGLMTHDEADAVWQLCRQTAALELTDAPAAPAARQEGAFTWRVELSLDGVEHHFEVGDARNQPDRRYARLTDGIIRAVTRRAGELPFRNVFVPSARLGWLDVVSIPAAHVFLDGADTGVETPVYGYEIEAGRHAIRLESLDGELTRAYDVRVEPGGTTHLHVDLR